MNTLLLIYLLIGFLFGMFIINSIDDETIAVIQQKYKIETGNEPTPKQIKTDMFLFAVIAWPLTLLGSINY